MPGQVVVITEGITRVDALAGVGIPAVAMSGVWSWRGRNDRGGTTALADFDDLNIAGSRFLLAPDGDVLTNGSVYAAITRLTALLISRGAESVQVLIPPERAGLDDYVAGLRLNGASDLDVVRELAGIAVDPSTIQRPVEDLGEEDDRLSAADYEALIRCLEANAGRVLCVLGENGIYSLAVLEEGGTWRRYEPGVLDTWLRDSEAEYFRSLLGSTRSTRTALMRKTQSRIESGTHIRRTIEIGGHASVTMALERGVALKTCKERDLDAVGRFLGAPNGVIDLETGALLTGDDAAERFITRRVADPYEPEARSEVVDRLFAHLAADEREWILGAFGFALRGSPQRRVYLLRGEAGGGKSTLVKAVTAALGEYGTGMDKEGLVYSKNAHRGAAHPALIPFLGLRVVTASEVGGAYLDKNLLKMLSGEDEFDVRALYANPMRGTATATLFMTGNSLPHVDLRDSGMRERFYVLPYPKVPPEAIDPTTITAVVNDPAVRQALMALLVKAATENTIHPPASIPQVEEARKAAEREHDDGAKEWLDETFIAASGYRLSTRRVWEMALDVSGGEGRKEAFGMGQKTFGKFFREAFDLPMAAVLWVDGKKQQAYEGVRLREATDEQAPLEAEPEETGPPQGTRPGGGRGVPRLRSAYARTRPPPASRPGALPVRPMRHGRVHFGFDPPENPQEGDFWWDYSGLWRPFRLSRTISGGTERRWDLTTLDNGHYGAVISPERREAMAVLSAHLVPLTEGPVFGYLEDAEFRPNDTYAVLFSLQDDRGGNTRLGEMAPRDVEAYFPEWNERYLSNGPHSYHAHVRLEVSPLEFRGHYEWRVYTYGIHSQAARRAYTTVNVPVTGSRMLFDITALRAVFAGATLQGGMGEGLGLRPPWEVRVERESTFAGIDLDGIARRLSDAYGREFTHRRDGDAVIFTVHPTGQITTATLQELTTGDVIGTLLEHAHRNFVVDERTRASRALRRYRGTPREDADDDNAAQDMGPLCVRLSSIFDRHVTWAYDEGDVRLTYNQNDVLPGQISGASIAQHNAAEDRVLFWLELAADQFRGANQTDARRRLAAYQTGEVDYPVEEEQDVAPPTPVARVDRPRADDRPWVPYPAVAVEEEQPAARSRRWRRT